MPKRLLLALITALFLGATSHAAEHPNIILIVADNLGYGDIGCFGSTVNDTPELDQMAAEGMKLTSFYSASSVCTPSRAAFMTGCYPQRVSMEMSATRRVVLQPVAQKGLNPGEITIAELLKQQDYATHCIGKWHLGDQTQFLPTAQGFDSWLGVPYSEDMIATAGPRLGEMWPPLPLVRNNTVIEAPVDPNTLTERYTEDAIAFIKKHSAADRPFFLYLPHAVPGSSTAAFAGEKFRGKSRNGIWGDCMMELSWSTGEILKTLKEENIDNNTLVIWTSDNGAFHGNKRERPMGSNEPLRGTGGQPSEGGFRVPCIARWPGKIPADSVCDELTTSMDLLPTIAELAGVEPPRDRIIDGKDIWQLLVGKENAKSPHEHFLYYRTGQLRGVRSGKWKLLLPVNVRAGQPWAKAVFAKLELFDLEADLSETTNLAGQHPDIVKRLTAICEQTRQTLGDVTQLGSEQRPAGWLDSVVALRAEGLPSDRGFPSDAIPLLFSGTGLNAWDMEASTGWAETSSAALDLENRKQLKPAAIPPNRFDTVGGVLHNTDGDPTGKKGESLQSAEDFGDIELHIEFQLSEKSNSGVYLMGRYEVQMLDSFGKSDAELVYGDNGGIYQRWDESREKKGYEGTPPKTNASRPAGEWQSFDIVFKAPRFDQDGKKAADATFVSVHHNGALIHENVTCSGPTRGNAFEGEVASAPITVQGNHGPVALRNIWVRPK